MSEINNTQKKKFNTATLVQLAMIIAIMIILDVTGLGLIKIPPVAITILHIPVIVGAIVMGPACGAILGGAFGVISLLEASFKATSPADLAFSPFLSGNPIGSLIMCVGCRILMGWLAGMLFRWISKLDKTNIIAAIVSAGVASIVHSFTVLSCLWLLFPELQFTFKAVLLAVLSVNGLLECAAAIVFGVAFAKVVPIIRKSMKKS